MTTQAFELVYPFNMLNALNWTCNSQVHFLCSLVMVDAVDAVFSQTIFMAFLQFDETHSAGLLVTYDTLTLTQSLFLHIVLILIPF